MQITIADLKNILEVKRQVFLTGAGGTGKTYTLKALLPHFKKPLKLASTNAAAIRIGGSTVHSAFFLGIATTQDELIAGDKRLGNAYYSKMKTLKSILSKVDLIVIDEISMLSDSVFSLLFSRVGKCGIEMPPLLMIGDLYQLPPVKNKESLIPQQMIYYSRYFQPIIIELTKIKRTNSIEFAEAQKYIRKGEYSRIVHNVLYDIQRNSFDSDFKPTILTATNKEADFINNAQLAKLQTQEYIFKANIKTDISDTKQIDSIIQSMPTDRELTLKIGARVMFVANNKGLYYNGMQGVIKGFVDDGEEISVLVLTDSGDEIKVDRFAFEKLKLVYQGSECEYVTELQMRQIPLRVAYAMTIHKSQGASIKQLEIDCLKIFEAGQFYVAISRGENPRLIRLKNFNPAKHIAKNADLTQYMESVSVIDVDEIEDSAKRVQIDISNIDSAKFIANEAESLESIDSTQWQNLHLSLESAKDSSDFNDFIAFSDDEREVLQEKLADFFNKSYAHHKYESYNFDFAPPRYYTQGQITISNQWGAYIIFIREDMKDFGVTASYGIYCRVYFDYKKSQIEVSLNSSQKRKYNCEAIKDAIDYNKAYKDSSFFAYPNYDMDAIIDKLQQDLNYFLRIPLNDLKPLNA